MKIIVKEVFFDENGIHKKGEVVDVEKFDERRMEKVEAKPATKKTVKK